MRSPTVETKRGRPHWVMNWQPISKQNPEIGRIDLRHDVVTLNRKEVNTDEIPESRTGKAGATLCTRRSGTRWRWRFQNRNRLPQRRVAQFRRQVARRPHRNRLPDQGAEIPRLQDRNRLPEPQPVQDRNPLREQGLPRLPYWKRLPYRNRFPEPRREPRFQDRNPLRKQVGSSWLLRIRGPGAMVTHCLTGSRFG